MQSINRNQRISGVDADDLRRMVGPDPHRPGADRGRLLAEQVPVWAIIGYLRAITGTSDMATVTDDAISEAATSYDMGRTAVLAALLYYEEHRCAVDTFLDANAAAFS